MHRKPNLIVFLISWITFSHWHCFCIVWMRLECTSSSCFLFMFFMFSTSHQARKMMPFFIHLHAKNLRFELSSVYDVVTKHGEPHFLQIYCLKVKKVLLPEPLVFISDFELVTSMNLQIVVCIKIQKVSTRSFHKFGY
jgi:hypothetical protein